MPEHWHITDQTGTDVLISLFRNSEVPQDIRDEAFIYLTYRFRGNVLKKCERLCKRYRYDVSTAEMITDKTFEAFARKGHSFDAAKGNGRNIDQSFLLYLLSIAERELVSYYRDIQRKLQNPYRGSEAIIHDLEDISEESLSLLSTEARVEFEIIKSVSAEKRAIYLTYTFHQRKGFKMPRKLLAEMRTEFNLQQNTINAYLKEVRDTIKHALKAYQISEKLNEDE